MVDTQLTEREVILLKREFKKAKLFEVRRVVRRIRQLRNKKGTSTEVEKNHRKASRFEKELEFMKEAEVAEILIQISGSDNKDELVGREDRELRNRALQRIVSSVPIQRFLNKKDSSESNKELKKARITPNKSPRLTRDTEERDEGLDSVSFEAPESKPKNLASVFVTSMSSASISSDQQVNAKARKKGKLKEKGKKSKEKNKVKNRMGQRGRQKVWENLYGREAKHLKKQKLQESSLETEVIPTSNKFLKKKSKQKLPPNAKQSVDEKLHPSWQAMKKRKLEQSIKVEFKGQKIKFGDDSD